MTTTATAAPYSWSNKTNTRRWMIKTDNPKAGAIRAYLIDCAHYKLERRYYLVSLIGEPGAFSVKVEAIHMESSIPIYDSAMASVEKDLVMAYELTGVEDVQVAIKKFERVCSNVMHGQLEPSTKVMKFWADHLAA